MKKLFATIFLQYLRLASKLQLAKNPRALVIGVTGTAGKSSTVEALALILGTKGKVKRTAGTNSETGIPLNILGLKITHYNLASWLSLALQVIYQLATNWERYDYYLVEMGIDSPNSPKNMDYLLSLIRPDVGVMLGVGLTHAEAFDHLVVDRNPARRDHKLREVIAREKLKLIHAVKPSGIVVVVTDQPEVKNVLGSPRARLITVGTGKTARMRLTPPVVSGKGFRFALTYQGQTHSVNLVDPYEPAYLYTFSAALAVASGLGIPLSTSIPALAKYRAPAGRLRLFAGIKHTHLLDSSYNASPDTVKNALFLLKRLGGRSHKLAILGDMRELGVASKQAHQELANLVKDYADQVILFGQETGEYTLPPLLRARFPARHYATMADLLRELPSLIKPKSWILVKGSQNTILLERVVEALLANQGDVQFLCRRGRYWDGLRARTP